MMKKILRNTLAKKLAVFAVSFFVIGGLSAVTALSPPRGSGAVLHVPPFDITQISSISLGDFSFANALKALTSTARVLYEEEVEEYEPVFEEEPAPRIQQAFARAIPAERPLAPHVDTKGFFYLRQIPLSYELQRYTFERSVALGLEYELVLALMWRESTFRIDAIGVNRNGTRDTGLMQINDVNHGWLRERYGIYNLMDPRQNIDAGTMILADLLSRYSEAQALVAYQFGEGGMLRMVRDGVCVYTRSSRVREKRYEYRAVRAQVFEGLNL